MQGKVESIGRWNAIYHGPEYSGSRRAASSGGQCSVFQLQSCKHWHQHSERPSPYSTKESMLITVKGSST